MQVLIGQFSLLYFIVQPANFQSLSELKSFHSNGTQICTKYLANLVFFYFLTVRFGASFFSLRYMTCAFSAWDIHPSRKKLGLYPIKQTPGKLSLYERYMNMMNVTTTLERIFPKFHFLICLFISILFIYYSTEDISSVTRCNFFFFLRYNYWGLNPD